jgi:hypothetical protein
MNTYTITLDRSELQTVLNGLGELPARVSIALIHKLQHEVFLAEQAGDTQQTATPEDFNGLNS